MSEASAIAINLPDVPDVTPVSHWIHSRSVTGPFGITAAVRDFEEVLDWQEHRRELVQGYYRLIPPPQVRRLRLRIEAAYPGFHAVLFTSGPLAEKELRELLEVSGLPAALTSHTGFPSSLGNGGAHALHLRQEDLTAGAALLPSADLAAALHERNRRRGGSLSARVAEAMQGRPLDVQADPAAATRCRDRLCELEGAQRALFYPSGMGAVTAVLDEWLTPRTPRLLVLGNVYRDTHLLLEEQRWAGRAVAGVFLGTHDLDGLAAGLADPAVAGVLVETITNPRIEIPDLPRIAACCRRFGKPLIVDSTMAAPLNCQPLSLGADLVIHSTSKYLSGHNTHGGGVVLGNDHPLLARVAAAQVRDENRLAPPEYSALWRGLQSFPGRLRRFNRNGEAMADLLRRHPAVGEVCYGNAGRPDWLHGLAGVVSAELRNPSLPKLAAFFNAPLPGVIKAPSLGSDQTLFCPYVLLAYYDKSGEYLKSCGLSRTLLRFAMGSEEELSTVLTGVEQALTAADLRS